MVLPCHLPDNTSIVLKKPVYILTHGSVKTLYVPDGDITANKLQPWASVAVVIIVSVVWTSQGYSEHRNRNPFDVFMVSTSGTRNILLRKVSGFK